MAAQIGGALGPLALQAINGLLKSGMKTTEAWLAVVSVLLCAVGAGMQMQGADISPLWGAWIAGISIGYSLSRSQSKTGAKEAVAEIVAATTEPVRTAQAPTLADRARGVGLALALVLLVSACAGAPGMVPDRPDHTTAVSCDAVEPLHRRLELAVLSGDLDDRLDDVARLNDSYRRVCVDGSPVGLEAELLMNDFLAILERHN